MMTRKFYLSLIFSFLLSCPSFAGEWQYDISGSATSFFGYYDAKDNSSRAIGNIDLNLAARYVFNNEYEAGIYADFMYGIDHELEDYNQGKWGEEIYAIADSPYGRLMLGQTFNVAAQFHNGAPNIIEDSNIADFITNPNWQRKGHYARFTTLNTTYINTDGVAPKISYISPEYYNTMLGLTYVPETYNRRGLINKYASYYDKGGYILGLYNSFDVNSLTVTTSLGYAEFFDNDKEFSAGLSLSRGNWTLGGSWRKTNADSKNPISKSTTENTPEWFDGYRDAYAWDIGIGYEFGPYKASLSYFNAKSSAGDNEDKIIMFANQYQVNKYIDVYLMASHVDFEEGNASLKEDNDGYAFITGLSLKF